MRSASGANVTVITIKNPFRKKLSKLSKVTKDAACSAAELQQALEEIGITPTIKIKDDCAPHLRYIFGYLPYSADLLSKNADQLQNIINQLDVGIDYWSEANSSDQFDPNEYPGDINPDADNPNKTIYKYLFKIGEKERLDKAVDACTALMEIDVNNHILFPALYALLGEEAGGIDVSLIAEDKLSIMAKTLFALKVNKVAVTKEDIIKMLNQFQEEQGKFTDFDISNEGEEAKGEEAKGEEAQASNSDINDGYVSLYYYLISGRDASLIAEAKEGDSALIPLADLDQADIQKFPRYLRERSIVKAAIPEFRNESKLQEAVEYFRAKGLYVINISKDCHYSNFRARFHISKDHEIKIHEMMFTYSNNSKFYYRNVLTPIMASVISKNIVKFKNVAQYFLQDFDHAKRMAQKILTDWRRNANTPGYNKKYSLSAYMASTPSEQEEAIENVYVNLMLNEAFQEDINFANIDAAIVNAQNEEKKAGFLYLADGEAPIDSELFCDNLNLLFSNLAVNDAAISMNHRLFDKILPKEFHEIARLFEMDSFKGIFKEALRAINYTRLLQYIEKRPNNQQIVEEIRLYGYSIKAKDLKAICAKSNECSEEVLEGFLKSIYGDNRDRDFLSLMSEVQVSAKDHCIQFVKNYSNTASLIGTVVDIDSLVTFGIYKIVYDSFCPKKLDKDSMHDLSLAHVHGLVDTFTIIYSNLIVDTNDLKSKLNTLEQFHMLAEKFGENKVNALLGKYSNLSAKLIILSKKYNLAKRESRQDEAEFIKYCFGKYINQEIGIANVMYNLIDTGSANIDIEKVEELKGLLCNRFIKKTISFLDDYINKNIPDLIDACDKGDFYVLLALIANDSRAGKNQLQQLRKSNGARFEGMIKEMQRYLENENVADKATFVAKINSEFAKFTEVPAENKAPKSFNCSFQTGEVTKRFVKNNHRSYLTTDQQYSLAQSSSELKKILSADDYEKLAKIGFNPRSCCYEEVIGAIAADKKELFKTHTEIIFNILLKADITELLTRSAKDYDYAGFDIKNLIEDYNDVMAEFDNNKHKNPSSLIEQIKKTRFSYNKLLGLLMALNVSLGDKRFMNYMQIISIIKHMNYFAKDESSYSKLPTGSGKTFVLVMTAIMHAISGRTVFYTTTSQSLTTQAIQEFMPLFSCGLISVTAVRSHDKPEDVFANISAAGFGGIYICDPIARDLFIQSSLRQGLILRDAPVSFLQDEFDQVLEEAIVVRIADQRSILTNDLDRNEWFGKLIKLYESREPYDNHLQTITRGLSDNEKKLLEYEIAASLSTYKSFKLDVDYAEFNGKIVGLGADSKNLESELPMYLSHILAVSRGFTPPLLPRITNEFSLGSVVNLFTDARFFGTSGTCNTVLAKNFNSVPFKGMHKSNLQDEGVIYCNSNKGFFDAEILKYINKRKSDGPIIIFARDASDLDALYKALSEPETAGVDNQNLYVFGPTYTILKGKTENGYQEIDCYKKEIILGDNKGRGSILLLTREHERGMDLCDTSSVIITDPTLSLESKIQQAGRTARAGKQGWLLRIILESRFDARVLLAAAEARRSANLKKKQFLDERFQLQSKSDEIKLREKGLSKAVEERLREQQTLDNLTAEEESKYKIYNDLLKDLQEAKDAHSSFKESLVESRQEPLLYEKAYEKSKQAMGTVSTNISGLVPQSVKASSASIVSFGASLLGKGSSAIKSIVGSLPYKEDGRSCTARVTRKLGAARGLAATLVTTANVRLAYNTVSERFDGTSNKGRELLNKVKIIEDEVKSAESVKTKLTGIVQEQKNVVRMAEEKIKERKQALQDQIADEAAALCSNNNQKNEQEEHRLNQLSLKDRVSKESRFTNVIVLAWLVLLTLIASVSIMYKLSLKFRAILLEKWKIFAVITFLLLSAMVYLAIVPYKNYKKASISDTKPVDLAGSNLNDSQNHLPILSA